MAINFPDNPTLNETFISGDKTWRWTGTRWEIVIIDPVLLTDYYTSTEVNAIISGLVDSAPSSLNTLKELAIALGNDENFSTTIFTALADKQNKIVGVSDTEISYLANVTSDIQQQINNAGPISTVVSSNITLSKGKYFVNTSVARTLTLPLTPSLGDEIQIFDANGTAGTNNITIANNGQKINGVLDSALLDVNGVAAVFVYTGSTYGWRMG